MNDATMPASPGAPRGPAYAPRSAVARALTIEDLRLQARRRLPRVIFEFIDRGAYDERTLAENVNALARRLLRQRVMVDVSRRRLGVSHLGRSWALPLVLGPAGMTGLFHADGEIHAAKAAQSMGIPYCLSTVSICSIEEVAAATRQPFWFQLYMLRDRSVVEQLLDRAEAAGCGALVLGADVPVHGQRHQDIRNGMSVPPRMTGANLLSVLGHPRWICSMLRSGRRTFGNLSGVNGLGDVSSITTWVNQQFDGALTWRDLEWLRARWKGPLVIKGVLDPQDAAEAAARGVDGIVVSNHGGRQLDGAPATIDRLGAIVERVGASTHVFLDGGVRSGQDVVRAMALGARAVWLGRAYLYGLAAGGEGGVVRAIEILRKELDTTLGLTGFSDVAALDHSALDG